MSSRFVRADVATLSLSGGDTLTVRRRLNAGETHQRLARMTEQVNGELKIKLLDVPMATITAYLLDWTFTDDSGATIPIRGVSLEELEATINNLDPADFQEVREAIDTHHAAMQAERDALKKNGWREHVVQQLNVARRMSWRYEWVEELDADVYQVLVDELVKEQRET